MKKFEYKGTPGRWSIIPVACNEWEKVQCTQNDDGSKGFEYQAAWIVNSEGNMLADVRSIDGPGFIKPADGHFEANALLIAAAPLLLSVLVKAIQEYDLYVEKILAFCDEQPINYPDWYHEAIAALTAAGVTITEVDDINVADLQTEQP